jgi:hypothetical protein
LVTGNEIVPTPAEEREENGIPEPNSFERLGISVADQVLTNALFLPAKTKNSFGGLFKIIVRDRDSGDVVFDELMPFDVALAMTSTMAHLMTRHISRFSERGLKIDTMRVYYQDLLDLLRRGKDAFDTLQIEAPKLFVDDSTERPES